MTYDEVGDVITYSFLLTNSGNVTLYAPYAVTDPLVGTVTCPATPASLAVGESVTCTGSNTIDQADLDAGSVVNTATATANDGQQQPVTSNEDDETVTAVQNAALTLVKSADPMTYDEVGDVITYSFLLTNSGNVTLYAPYAVTDPLVGTVTCPATPASLAVGESVTCTGSNTIDQADLDAGSVVNTATATANDSQQQPVTSNEDDETVTAEILPDLTITKTNDAGTPLYVGDTFTWTMVVSNSGGTASFAEGEVVFSDSLPAGATYANVYGTPAIPNLDCGIDASNVVFCNAMAGGVNLADGQGFTIDDRCNPDASGYAGKHGGCGSWSECHRE